MSYRFALLICCFLTIPTATLHAEDYVFRFEDVTDQVGLAEPLKDWAFGHGGAWGDLNGDDRPDLYVGAFADRAEVFVEPENPPIPNQLFLSTPSGEFELSPEKSIRFEGTNVRTTFAMFVDLDNDHDLDLFVGNHILSGRDDKPRWGNSYVESKLFENTGNAQFRDVTPQASADGWPAQHAIRDGTAVDLDMDGLLDLVMTDGDYAHTTLRLPNNYRSLGDGEGRLVLLRNRGDWTWDDVTDEYGMPKDHTMGMGLAIGDVNDDGQLDFFVPQANRLFVSKKQDAGEAPWRWHEAEVGRFVGPRISTDSAMTCGATFGDLNNDGKLDLVTTLHALPGQIDVYLNRTTDADHVRFEHVTHRTGLPLLIPEVGRKAPVGEYINGIPVKGTHVAIQDMDRDGLNDLVIAILWTNDEGEDQPMVLRNLGLGGADASKYFGEVSDDVPQFDITPFKSVAAYAAPAPLADYDRDGLLDMAFVSWFSRDESVGTRLYRNVTPGGHYLSVRVRGDGKHMNTDGIGATVRLYKAGHLGEADALLGRQDVTTGQGYSGATEPILYFGLGDVMRCDVHVKWDTYEAVRRDVSVDQTVEINLPEATGD